jgi:16S rRNA (uracil1498-N3)-methyltransferase
MTKTRRRTPRVYVSNACDGQTIALGDRETHYLVNVLRLRRGHDVIAFDGNGNECLARIDLLTRRAGLLRIIERLEPLPESSIEIVLIQGILKSEAMDLVVQKATELGVTRIWPLASDHSVVHLRAERAIRKLEHWQRVARGACEQSGRHRPPEILAPALLDETLERLRGIDLVLALDPNAGPESPTLPPRTRSVAAIVGPEGGFSARDLALIEQANCLRLRLGQRILRAETAAIAVCAFVQSRWGDLN